MLPRALVALLVCVGGASSAGAGAVALDQRMPQPAQVMRQRAETFAPYAFADFCRRTPRECNPDSVKGHRMDLTPQRWHDLLEVNAIVNNTVIPRSDLEVYGVFDYWTIAGRYGDCEDYALTKQLYLRDRGWPMSDLLMTVVRDENGEGHAILTVRTTRGEFVLDNRQSQIVAWTEAPYTFVKRQADYDPKIWLALEAPEPIPDVGVATMKSPK
jgi:predicted transglutaminase-like cysteine proteinase